VKQNDSRNGSEIENMEVKKNLHKERGSGKMSRPRKEEHPAYGPLVEHRGRIVICCVITQWRAVLHYHNLPIVHRKTEANHT